MKADKLLEELIALAKTREYDVRREIGTFRGGSCIVKDRRLILVNRSMPLEAACVVLARALVKLGVEDEFIKPAVRDIIDRERLWVGQHPEVTFEPEMLESTTQKQSA